jgi:hypothetical protein
MTNDPTLPPLPWCLTCRSLPALTLTAEMTNDPTLPPLPWCLTCRMPAAIKS